MPRIARVNLLVALLAVAALVAGTSAIAAPHDVTTGQFLVEIAKAQKLDAADPASASNSLRAAGFRVPDVQLEKPLTEGTVSSIATALGLRITTHNPDATFNNDQMDAFLKSFSRDLGIRTGETSLTGADPLTKGKGKKKGLTKSRSEPY
jgi:hypothetical protein